MFYDAKSMEENIDAIHMHCSARIVLCCSIKSFKSWKGAM